MPADPACRERGCPSAEGRPRHAHLCHDLNQIGEDCATCGFSQWVIWFGGVLPALIRCGSCGRGFNLSERLRQTTQPGKTGVSAIQ